MKLLKKWGILLVAVVFILIIAVMSIMFMGSIKQYQNTVNEQQATIVSLEDGLNQIGETVECYTINRSVRVGEQITEDMLTPVTVPVHIAYSDQLIKNDDGTETRGNALSVVTSVNDVVGKFFRVSLGNGAILLNDFVQTETTDNSARFMEIMVDSFPTDIVSGDYVDIRIQFTYGEDFIALSHRKILKADLTNNLFTFEFNENDMGIYNSMLLDKAMYSGVRIYMLKYVDTTSQTAAEAYYPLNKNIAEMLAINPNVIEAVKDEMTLERTRLNTILGGDIESFDEQALGQVKSYLDTIRRDNETAKNSSIRERATREQQEAQEQARAEAQAAADAAAAAAAQKAAEEEARKPKETEKPK